MNKIKILSSIVVLWSLVCFCTPARGDEEGGTAGALDPFMEARMRYRSLKQWLWEQNIKLNIAGQRTGGSVEEPNAPPEAEPYPVITYEYNSNREMTKKSFPEGNWIDYTYNANGNLLSICREPNNGDPNIIITYTYESEFNFIKTITNPRGKVFTATYDYEDPNYGTEVGDLMKITFPEVNTPSGYQTPVISFTYNNYGQMETITLPDGLVIKGVYYQDANDVNNFGHLWKVIVDYNDTDGLNITTEYQYDVLGRVIEFKDPNGDITQLEYNALDQLTKITSPLNNVVNLRYNDCRMISQVEMVREGDNQLIDFTYNILDKLETITDPLGYVTTLGYIGSLFLTDVNDAEENNTHYDYDVRELLCKVTDANGGITELSYNYNEDINEISDPNGDITTAEYDGFDRLVCITYPDDTNETFGYDAASNVTSWKTRDGNTINYKYDALNRITVKNRPGEPNIMVRYDIAGWVYDINDGRSVSNGGGLTDYYYDRIGRVNDVVDPEGKVVSYEYDNRGLRTKLIYPDDSYITYEYDAMGRVVKIKDDDGEAIAQYSYDELSRRTLLTLGNDANAVYEYDLNNRLTKLTNNLDDTNSIIFDYSNYDKVGNRKSCKIDDADAHVYTYDNLYQLTEVDYNDGSSTTYYYDSLGNRTSVVDGGTTSYLRNSLNQYTGVGPEGWETPYSYDKNGNLTDDGTYEYYYDCENRLLDVNENGSAIASYKYDFAGRRVRKIVDGNTTKYCYDGGQVIAEYDGSDNPLRKFVYGPGIDEPIIIIDVADNNTVYYYHFDGLCSVAALSNVNGEIVERYSYDVFGEPTIRDANNAVISESAVGNSYMFTGRRWDNETDNYFYRMRYYNPEIGRFLQADPIGYAVGLNLYSYCGNNPINWIDPWGLDTLGIHGGTGHSWISYTTDDGITTTYGLWHDDYASDSDRLRVGTDIRVNLENSKTKIARYYELTDSQKNNFERWIRRNHKYHMPFGIPTHNCSSWVSDTVKFVIGENINADAWYFFGVETPEELRESIQKLEESDPTNIYSPKETRSNKSCSSSSSSSSSSW